MQNARLAKLQAGIKIARRNINNLKYAEATTLMGFPGRSVVKASACNAGDPGSIPGLGRFPWRRKWQPTPVIFAWRIPWTEEPGGLQSTGLQRVGHN